MTPKQIQKLIATDLKATDALLRKALQSQVSLINDISTYIIDNGGKRIRPILSLLCAHALGYQGKHHQNIALIIETIHTATLLHDDVVDDSTMRRGRKTANIVWDNPEAVLSGDFLYSKAFVLMAELMLPEAMLLLTQCTNAIAEGEVMQLVNSHRIDITEQDYFDVIYHKTAKLFEAACQLPALLVSTTAETQQALATYGRHIGTAFQLIDDVMDYTSDSATMGKNLGDDFAEGKMTLPLIYVMTNGNSEQRQLIAAAMSDPDQVDIQAISTLLQQTGALTYAKECAKQETERAKQALNALNDTPYRSALLALCDLAIERKK